MYEQLYMEFLNNEDFKRLDPAWLMPDLLIKGALGFDEQERVSALVANGDRRNVSRTFFNYRHGRRQDKQVHVLDSKKIIQASAG